MVHTLREYGGIAALLVALWNLLDPARRVPLACVVPIKAVLMNALSLGASYGLLVWVFQDGHFADRCSASSRSTASTRRFRS